jgi:hypothetical protein
MILDAMLLLLSESEKSDPDSYRNVQKVQLTHMILDAMLLLQSKSEKSDPDSYRDAQKCSLLT